jgi:hypothetical protein
MKLTFEIEATREDGKPCGQDAVADEIEINLPEEVWVARDDGGESHYTLTGSWVDSGPGIV